MQRVKACEKPYAWKSQKPFLFINITIAIIINQSTSKPTEQQQQPQKKKENTPPKIFRIRMNVVNRNCRQFAHKHTYRNRFMSCALLLLLLLFSFGLTISFFFGVCVRLFLVLHMPMLPYFLCILFLLLWDDERRAFVRFILLYFICVSFKNAAICVRLRFASEPWDFQMKQHFDIRKSMTNTQ